MGRAEQLFSFTTHIQRHLAPSHSGLVWSNLLFVCLSVTLVNNHKHCPPNQIAVERFTELSTSKFWGSQAFLMVYIYMYKESR